MGKALDFIEEFDQNDNLFIVYYAGHGTMNEHRQLVWSCRRDLQYASVDWSSIQSLFSKASSDVLVLLDCCAAASSATTSGNGVTETIAASGFEGRAPPPGRFSFSNTLIEVLEDWKTRPSFSAASLHTEILFQLKVKRPEKGRNDGPRMEWCRTPVHFVYSSDPKASSIELCRREPREITDHSAVGRVFQPSSSRPTTYIESAELSHCVSQNASASTDPAGALIVPHVLISVALEESQENLDLESWRRWLTGIPALVKYAVIEGAYRSHSTLLILSLPVMIWDMLPGHPACSFIGYVNSPNIWTACNCRIGFKESSRTLPDPRDDNIMQTQASERLGHVSSSSTIEPYIPVQRPGFMTKEPLWAPETLARTGVKESHHPQELHRAGSTTPPSTKTAGHPLICPTCHKCVETQHELEMHNLRHRNPLMCDSLGCSRIEGFGSINDLDRHVNSKHPKDSPVVQQKRYRCPVQGCKSHEKSWPRVDNFRSHLKRVHGNELRTADEFEEVIKRHVIIISLVLD